MDLILADVGTCIMKEHTVRFCLKGNIAPVLYSCAPQISVIAAIIKFVPVNLAWFYEIQGKMATCGAQEKNTPATVRSGFYVRVHMFSPFSSPG